MTLAQQLFDQAFDRPRDPRSVAYKAGVLAALTYRVRRSEMQPATPQRDALHMTDPYKPGTAESDAWHAGTSEGHALWRDYAASGLTA